MYITSLNEFKKASWLHLYLLFRKEDLSNVLSQSDNQYNQACQNNKKTEKNFKANSTRRPKKKG